MRRFFTNRTNLREGSSLKLDDEEALHLRKVLRLGKGDKIIVFNGEKEFLGELKLVSREAVMVSIEKLLRENLKEEIEVTLFQGILKAGKIEEIVKAVTELGITRIIPVECEYSQSSKEKWNNKIDRLRKIAISASKQSERISVPGIFTPMSFSESLEILKEFDLAIFFTYPRRTISLSNELKFIPQLKNYKNIAIFIGPEGGFSPIEHKLAEEKNMTFSTFNKNVLTSETASISAVAIVMNNILAN